MHALRMHAALVRPAHARMQLHATHAQLSPRVIQTRAVAPSSLQAAQLRSLQADLDTARAASREAAARADALVAEAEARSR